MASIFTKIINRDIASYIVAEEADYIAFLDVYPLAVGHTLVVPKKEIDYMFNLDDSTLTGLILFSKKVAIGIQKAIPCLRVGMAVVGLEVPHAHIHLIPLHDIHDDINFKKPKLKLSKVVLDSTAHQLKAAIAQVT